MKNKPRSFRWIARSGTILLSAILTSAATSATDAPLLKYDTVYRGIQVGVSNRQDVLDRLGNPTGTSTYNKNVHYKFGDVQITIMSTTGVVESISISDKTYTDANGIRIGTPKRSVEAILKKKSDEGHIIDKHRGIIYWLADDKVSKIVLPYKMLDK